MAGGGEAGLDWEPLIGPIVTALVAGMTAYAAMSARLARIEQKVDDLAKDVQRHNHVVERTAVLERDVKTVWGKYDELHEEVKEVRRMQDGRQDH
jgi:outer membrane murein-binding lipoprotein Lpp